MDSPPAWPTSASRCGGSAICRRLGSASCGAWPSTATPATYEGESSLLTSLADLQVLANDFADAVTTTTRALTIFRDDGNLVRETSAMALHVDALTRLGRPHEAIEAARGLSVDPDSLSGRPASVLLSRLGTAHSVGDDHERALALLQRAVAIAREDQATGDEAECLVRLAAGLHRAGELAAAHHTAARALDILTGQPDVGELVDLVDGHNVLGGLLVDLGRPGDALDHHRRALAEAARVDYRCGRADALNGIGLAQAALGDVRTAREHWRQALELYAELRVPEADGVRARLAQDH